MRKGLLLAYLFDRLKEPAQMHRSFQAFVQGAIANRCVPAISAAWMQAGGCSDTVLFFHSVPSMRLQCTPGQSLDCRTQNSGKTMVFHTMVITKQRTEGMMPIFKMVF